MELTLSHILFNRHSENIFLTLNLSMQIAICLSTCPLHHRLDFFMLLLLLCVRSLSRQSFLWLFTFFWVVCTRLFFLRWTKTKTYFFAFRGSKICWFLILFPSFYFETEGTTTANDAIKKQERRVQKSLFSWLSKNHSIEKLFHSSKS